MAVTAGEFEICLGKRMNDGALLGLCICFVRRNERPSPMTATAHISPPALRDDLGKWSCEKLIKPAGW